MESQSKIHCSSHHQPDYHGYINSASSSHQLEIVTGTSRRPFIQWEFQDPKMEVLYHISPYFVGIFTYIGLKNRPYIW